MKPIFVLWAALTLGGCVNDQLFEDLARNDFVGAKQSPIPAGLDGLWTGSMGPYLVTFSLQADGGGIYCYSYATAHSVSRVKFHDRVLLTQEGTRLSVSGFDDDRMRAKSPYFDGTEYIFYRDSALAQASDYCARQLSL